MSICFCFINEIGAGYAGKSKECSLGKSVNVCVVSCLRSGSRNVDDKICDDLVSSSSEIFCVVPDIWEKDKFPKRKIPL